MPHRQLKWQRRLITGLDVVPERLAQRLELLAGSGIAEALQAAGSLLADTVLLARAHTGADIRSFREGLSERRRAAGPPRREP